MFQIAPAAPDARAARPASAPLRRQDGPPHRRDPRGDPTHASLCAATAQTVGLRLQGADGGEQAAPRARPPQRLAAHTGGVRHSGRDLPAGA